MNDPHRSRELLLAGRVGRPHGLDGSFHVIDANPALLGLGATVTVAGRSLEIVRRAGDDRRPIVRLEGAEDRGAAQALAGEQLLVPRAQAPELEPDEWWAEDLEGCLVLDGRSEVGRVSRLLAFPSCEVLEVERDQAPALLVPLVADAVRRVDVERKEIEIDLAFLDEP